MDYSRITYYFDSSNIDFTAEERWYVTQTIYLILGYWKHQFQWFKEYDFVWQKFKSYFVAHLNFISETTTLFYLYSISNCNYPVQPDQFFPFKVESQGTMIM